VTPLIVRLDHRRVVVCDGCNVRITQRPGETVTEFLDRIRDVDAWKFRIDDFGVEYWCRVCKTEG
jgi:hypothetical protein